MNRSSQSVHRNFSSHTRTFDKLPTSLENDADAAAHGEALFGVGRTSSSVYYVTVSIGIGGDFIMRRSSSVRPMDGNIIIDSSWPAYPVPNLGSHEELANGTTLRALEK